MQITNLYSMYLAEVQELCSVEEQFSHALEHAGEAAFNPELGKILANHRNETQLQKRRLMSLLGGHGSAAEHTDQAMEALLRETEKMLAILPENELRDAGLIASVQKLAHYQIAAYGTVAALAGQLGLRSDQHILHQSLEDEKRMDAVLTKLAKGKINQTALAAV
jgi:ferritin-like metal-binding protein YciE